MSTELTTFNVDDTPLGTVQHFIDTSTAAGKAKLYNALQNSEKISDHLGEVINAANVIAQRVQVQNVSLFPEDFAGKTMAVYGRASGTAAVRQPYDGAEGQIVDWSLEFSSAYENPEADTMIVVTGSLTGDNAVMSGAVINILK